MQKPIEGGLLRQRQGRCGLAERSVLTAQSNGILEAWRVAKFGYLKRIVKLAWFFVYRANAAFNSLLPEFKAL
ncbi:MAG: hypothetical protein NWF09_03070 [Candidatus Bathyarchaeota archaeon]|nr:hypothetical protein [Candidatus Bathyarchaeota archaeon]